MTDGAPATHDDAEAARLRLLHELRVLDTDPEPCFDRIARTAAAVMNAPRACVVFVDRDRLWHKASVGIAEPDLPRRETLADRMIAQREVVLSEDIASDPRFAEHLNVRSLAGIRFYGCAPLIMPGDMVVGLLVVGDTQPHPQITPGQRQALADLAALTVDELARRLNERRAREQRRYDDQRVELALETAGLGEFEWDIATNRVHLTPRAMELTGAEDDELIGENGQVSYRFVHPDDVDRLRREIEDQLRQAGRYVVSYRIVRPNENNVRWMRGAGRLVIAPDGSTRLIGVLQDRTDRQMDEQHREALLAELDHRVKNVLAAVQSLAAQSARRTTSLDSFLKTFAGRLKAMASAHELLTATRWRGAAIGDIAAAELGGLTPGQARWEGPEIVLTPRAANALALTLHELAINAVRYGALSSETGRVQVSWRLRPGGGFVLDWSEQGGPPVTPPKTPGGFGSTFLGQVTTRELGGAVQVDFRRDGVRAHIEGEAAAIADSALQTSLENPSPGPTTGASVGEPQGPRGSVEGLRILIVEDAVLLALELEAGLVEAGAEVVGVAIDLDEAFALLNEKIDAAVLDVNLNGRLVTPLADQLQERGVPFVFATGYGEQATPEAFDVPIVRKPYNVHQIVSALIEATSSGG